MKDRERRHASFRRPATNDDQFPIGSKVPEPETGWTADAVRGGDALPPIVTDRDPRGHGNLGSAGNADAGDGLPG